MKKFTILVVLTLFTFSCTSTYEKEMIKTSKSRSASQRINSGQENNENILKELD